MYSLNDHKVKFMYNKALDKKSTRTKGRNLLWFKNPFSKTVTTNIFPTLMMLLPHHHNVMVRYCCSRNMQIINDLYKKIRNEKSAKNKELFLLQDNKRNGATRLMPR